MDAPARPCPNCRQATDSADICPHCGTGLSEPFSTYPRGMGRPRGVAAYGQSYRAVAIMYGLMPALAITYNIAAFWQSLVVPVMLNSTLSALGFMLVQSWAALAMWRGRRWGKFLAGVHAFVMLVFVLFFFSQTTRQLANNFRTWQETMAFVLAFGEALLTLAVLWQVARARSIDRDQAGTQTRSLP